MEEREKEEGICFGEGAHCFGGDEELECVFDAKINFEYLGSWEGAERYNPGFRIPLIFDYISHNKTKSHIESLGHDCGFCGIARSRPHLRSSDSRFVVLNPEVVGSKLGVGGIFRGFGFYM